MRAGGLFAVVLVAFLFAVFAVPAGAGHPQGSQASTALIEGSQGSVFRSAVAAAPPLEGTGENMEIVANVPLAVGEVPLGANDDDFANNAADIELAGDYAFVGSYVQGLVIINIASCDDPTKPQDCKPFVQSVLKCSGGQFDVQLSPDANIAVVAHESASVNKDCHPGEEGAQIIDISDKSAPKELAFISDRVGANADDSGEPSGQVPDGAHNVTLDWPTLYIDQYTNTEPVTDVYSLQNPSAPERIGGIDFGSNPANGASGPHDSYPDHRPDGKDLLYAASIQKSDIIDIGDPRNPKVLQTIIDPQVGISHGAESNFDRSLLIVTDEYGGGSGVGACGGNPDPDIPLPGQGQQVTSVGAVHFYNLNAEGLVGNGGTDKAGIFNITLQPNEPDQVAAEAGCTSHVFWQAPDQNRMTIAWYGRGTRVVDFSDPASPKQIGSFVPAGGDTWSAKPHRGFIFTGDIIRGMDVLRYTGENGQAWPTTSGPAEVQRARTQGVTTTPAGPANPGAGSGNAAGGRFVIGRRALRARRVARVLVACRKAVPCRGRIRLSVAQKGKRRLTIARQSFSVGANGRKTLRVRLTGQGQRLLRSKRRLRVKAYALLRPTAGASSGNRAARSSFRLSAPRR